MTARPSIVDPPEPTACVVRSFDWFSLAAIITWLVVGIWPFSEMGRGRFAYGGEVLYIVSFLAYGAAMLIVVLLPRARRRLSQGTVVALALVQTVTGLAMNVITVRYIQGTGAGVGLLVIVAAELPYLVSPRVVWSWIAVQTAVLIALFFPAFPGESITIGVATGGFQLFAAASSMLAIREGQARERLTRANAELTATRELLAESSRTEERLRISRDLHDTLGHHLTALSLQLDVAARLSEGKAAEHIRQAHAITRLLLSDVRDVVSTLRETGRLDLVDAVRALAVQPAGAAIHLELPDTLAVEDPGRADAILRAVQEVLTNAARHSHAANLWIRLEPVPGGVTLHVRDDGRGAAAVTWGNGLRGMRERYEQHGGRVEVRAAAGAGFEVQAFMPLTPAA